MKKKGFTLIELLAVIVILAIIALIATPVVLGVIEKAKKGAAQSSALGYIDAIEKQIAINVLDSSKENIADRTYSVEELKELGVTIKGTLPTGNVVVSKGQVIDYILGIDGYVVEDGVATKSTNTKKYDNGYAVYYDPTTGESCDTYQEANSLNETKTGCMKWHAFNDNKNSSTVNLLLDHNTTTTLAYNSDGTNEKMKEIKIALDDLVDENKWVNNPRIISALEVANILNLNDWTASSQYINMSFDTKEYSWLVEKTATHGDDTNYGYWTSTKDEKSNKYMWSVVWDGYLYDGSLNDNSVDKNNIWGLRPVITISKSLLTSE